MASTTKIMTALLVLERAGLDDRYTVPPEAEAVGGSTGRLVAGEELTVRDLLVALLVASGNDAAVTLADGVAGSQAAFVDLMNRSASGTRASPTPPTPTRTASTPPGTTPASATSSPGRRWRWRTRCSAELVSSRRRRIPGPGGVGRRQLESENELLDIDPEADGVKTGMTDGAGYALVAHARRASPRHRPVRRRRSASPARDGARPRRRRPCSTAGSPSTRGPRPRRRRRPGARRGATAGPGADRPSAARLRPRRRRCASASRSPRRSSPRRGGGPRSGEGQVLGSVSYRQEGRVVGPPRPRRRRVGRRARHPRPPPRRLGGARPVIVTVTLNAALDRTVACRTSSSAPRHRADSLAAPAGRQGRQHRPRAQAPRPAGHRDRARRRPRRHLHHRAADARRGSSTTSSASRRSRAPARRSSTPPTTSRPRSTSGARRVTGRPSSTCCSTRSATSRRAPTSSCSPGRCRATCPTDWYERARCASCAATGS